MMFADETTHIYPNGGGYLSSGRKVPGVSLACGPEMFGAGDDSLGPILRVKAKWILDDGSTTDGLGDGFTYGIYDPSTGFNLRWTTSGDFATSDVFWTGVQETWTTVEFPLGDSIADCAGFGPAYFDGNDWRATINMYTSPSDNTVPGKTWSGLLIDEAEIVMVQRDGDPGEIFDQTIEIPIINASWPTGETKTAHFDWDADVGNYVVETSILTSSMRDDPADNNCLTGYQVINVEERPDGITTRDLTGGPTHWMVEGCCGGYFWCGDPVTTEYGNNWDDSLIIAPGGDPTFDLSGKAFVDVEFDTWYNISADDFGFLEYSLDDGATWWNVATYNGKSINLAPDPDEFGWEHRIVTITDTFTAKTQFRFRFVSNATETNRGWFLDNIEIKGSQIFGPDDCTSFANFIATQTTYGDWWAMETMYEYFYDNGLLDPWILFYGSEPGWKTYLPTANGFWCGDDLWPTVARPWLGVYPTNINNALDWTIDTKGAFYGWLDGYLYYDVEASHDTFTYEISENGVDLIF